MKEKNLEKPAWLEIIKQIFVTDIQLPPLYGHPSSIGPY